MKRFVLCFLILFPSFVSSVVLAQCNVHDQKCMFHSIASQTTHIGSQSVHHTRGVQNTLNIPQTANGLYGIAEWKDNSSGQKADIDVEALLPDFSGPYVISNNAHLGGAPASVDPFAGIPDEHNRHIDTFQYQITLQNNTATATHSVDANGRAPIPNAQGCIAAGQSDSCEHVHIKGNIPTGIYEFTATNYDVFRLADPSSPEVTVYAGKVGQVNGEIFYLDQVGQITGALPNRGDALPNLRVGFVNHAFNPHAEGVVLDDYQRSFFSKKKYGNKYSQKKGDAIYTYQDTYRDHWGVKYQDRIDATGKVSNTVKKGLAWKRKNVFAGTNFVSKELIPKPQPVIVSTRKNARAYKKNSKNQNSTNNYESRKSEFNDNLSNYDMSDAPLTVKALSLIIGENNTKSIASKTGNAILKLVSDIETDRTNRNLPTTNVKLTAKEKLKLAQITGGLVFDTYDSLESALVPSYVPTPAKISKKTAKSLIKPKDIINKTPAQIDKLAKNKGLIPKGPNPQKGKGAYIDPVTKQQRILCHTNCSNPHGHVNNSRGQRLDINGNIVPKESPEAHLPIKYP